MAPLHHPEFVKMPIAPIVEAAHVEGEAVAIGARTGGRGEQGDGLNGFVRS